MNAVKACCFGTLRCVSEGLNLLLDMRQAHLFPR
jgi:hypothetical protein